MQAIGRRPAPTAEVKAALMTEAAQPLEIVQDNEVPEPFDEDSRSFGV
jgi:hypothetical protein